MVLFVCSSLGSDRNTRRYKLFGWLFNLRREHTAFLKLCWTLHKAPITTGHAILRGWPRVILIQLACRKGLRFSLVAAAWFNAVAILAFLAFFPPPAGRGLLAYFLTPPACPRGRCLSWRGREVPVAFCSVAHVLHMNPGWLFCLLAEQCGQCFLVAEEKVQGVSASSRQPTHSSLLMALLRAGRPGPSMLQAHIR